MISKSERAYFNAAKAISSMSDHKQKLGCVVVLGHKIVSSGCNSNSRKHKMQALLDKKEFGSECPGFLHAETDALLPLIRNNINLQFATIYIYREHKNGEVGMARPCSRCMKVIKRCGIQKIKYTTESGYAFEHIKE